MKAIRSALLGQEVDSHSMGELSWFAPNVRALHKIAVGKKNDRYERERKKDREREKF